MSYEANQVWGKIQHLRKKQENGERILNHECDYLARYNRFEYIVGVLLDGRADEAFPTGFHLLSMMNSGMEIPAVNMDKIKNATKYFATIAGGWQ